MAVVSHLARVLVSAVVFGGIYYYGSLIISPSSNEVSDVKTLPREISPILYGIFFEEINLGGTGGLYAEQLFNNDFEVQGRGAAGEMPRHNCRAAAKG